MSSHFIAIKRICVLFLFSWAVGLTSTTSQASDPLMPASPEKWAGQSPNERIESVPYSLISHPIFDSGLTDFVISESMNVQGPGRVGQSIRTMPERLYYVLGCTFTPGGVSEPTLYNGREYVSFAFVCPRDRLSYTLPVDMGEHSLSYYFCNEKEEDGFYRTTEVKLQYINGAYEIPSRPSMRHRTTARNTLSCTDQFDESALERILGSHETNIRATQIPQTLFCDEIDQRCHRDCVRNHPSGSPLYLQCYGNCRNNVDCIRR